MRSDGGNLTHPSWHRRDDQRSAPRESLMSQMVRAQLIFDRRTPAGGIPAWREVPDTSPASVDIRVEGDREATGEEEQSALPADAPAEARASFAQELAERLQLARERVEAEQHHLAQVGSVAAAYLGRPRLRLVK